jgi:sn-glycerol 3-phosphate transport system permease protein
MTVERWRLIGRYALLTALAAVVLFPIYVTIVNSLISAGEVSQRNWYTLSPQFGNYADAWSGGNFSRYLWNSAVMTVGITAGQVLTAIVAAYAFAFLEFPFRRALFVLFLATMMIPAEVTIYQNFQTVRDLDWTNSFTGLIVPSLASGFGAFLLRQSFLATPKDLRDAAFLDGYGHVRFLSRVVVPLNRPAIAAMGLFAFLGAWNQYLWPLLVTDDDRRRTVQIGLKQLRATQLDQLPVTYAGTVLAFAPIAILLILFSKQLIRGLAAGAVKG